MNNSKVFYQSPSICQADVEDAKVFCQSGSIDNMTIETGIDGDTLFI